jgi:hypothetical protein
MKVKDLIDILKDIPPDAEIRILTDVPSQMSGELFYKMKELTEEDIAYVRLGNFVNLGKNDF